MCVFCFYDALPSVGLCFIFLAEMGCSSTRHHVLFCKLKPEVIFPCACLVDVGGADAM